MIRVICLGKLKENYLKDGVQDYLNSEIIYTGATVDTLKSLEIRNEGGMIGFQISLEDLGNYTSNESVTYNGSLLSQIGITNEDMQFSMSFDLTITLDSNISFVGTFHIDLPTGDIIHEDEPYIKLNHFEDVIFN